MRHHSFWPRSSFPDQPPPPTRYHRPEIVLININHDTRIGAFSVVRRQFQKIVNEMCQKFGT